MWKHEIAALGVCNACGRLPERELPMFGPRCEVAVAEWELAQFALRRIAEHDAVLGEAGRPAVGRATVRTVRR